MTFYVFDSQASAVAAEAKIVANVRAWLAANAPDALTADGDGVRGRNAATHELVNVATQQWAIPVETVAGKWVFEKPVDAKTLPIPAAVFTAGIVAREAEYRQDWFAAVPWPPRG
jgi:hypothetical protein